MRSLTSLVAALVLSSSTVLVGCATSGTDATENVDDESSLPGSIDLWQASDGWHFHVVSGNKRILLASEAYASRTAAINGVLAMLDDGIDPHQYQVLPAAHGYLLHLVAGNNEVIGFTESYATKSSATRAIGSCVRAITSYLDKVNANTTGARVEVAAGSSGQYHFDLFAQNGQVILSSESYTSQAAAWNGAFACQDALKNPAAFAIKAASNGMFYFTLTAGNGQVVGTSQMYSTQEAAQTGIASVQMVLGSLDLI